MVFPTTIDASCDGFEHFFSHHFFQTAHMNSDKPNKQTKPKKKLAQSNPPNNTTKLSM